MQPTKRRLSDLWVTGREVAFDDGGGEPITVWLQKLNPTEASDTARRCDAARARRLSVKHDRDSDAWMALRASVLSYGDDIETLVELLVMEDRARSQRVRGAQIAAEEEWSDDNYLQGLYDAWEGAEGQEALKDRWATDHDDAEAKRVHEALDRYNAAVNEAVEDDVNIDRERYRAMGLEQCRELMTERLVEVDANQAWLDEMRRCQLYFGVRESTDRRQRYFASRTEVDELSTETFVRLRAAYDNLEVDVTEGKSLPLAPSSSPSSAPQSAGETADSSGLVAVGA